MPKFLVYKITSRDVIVEAEDEQEAARLASELPDGEYYREETTYEAEEMDD